MFGGGSLPPPISLEERMCGCRGGFLLTGGDARHISLLGFLLRAFVSSLRSPPFLSSAERQDGGAVAGYFSFLCPSQGWPMRSLDVLVFFFFRQTNLEVFPMLGAVLKRVMRLFSVLLLTDVVLTRHVLVLMYVSVCIHIYAPLPSLVLCC